MYVCKMSCSGSTPLHNCKKRSSNEKLVNFQEIGRSFCHKIVELINVATGQISQLTCVFNMTPGGGISVVPRHNYIEYGQSHFFFHIYVPDHISLFYHSDGYFTSM